MNRNLFAGWGKLVSNNVAAGVLQIIGFAIAAQALDIAVLGVIVLIQTYVRVVDGIFNFQSVNVLTRFLAEAQHTDDRTRFAGLVKAGLLVDGGAAALATVIAVVALPLIAPLVGIPAVWLGPTMAFALVILTRLFGASEASLRALDDFWSIGLRGTVQGVLLVAGSAVLWALGSGALAFLYLWLLSEVAANLWFQWHCWRVLRRNGIVGLRRARARAAIRSAPGFWPMLWQTNATLGLRLLSQDADVLVAGSVLGPGAASLLRAIKNCAAVVNQLGRPLQQVASAPLARLAVERRFAELLASARQLSLLAGAVSLVFVLAAALVGDQALALLYGAEYAAAQWPLVALLATASLYMFGIGVLPMVIALNKAGISLAATIIGSLVFFPLLFVLTGPLGLMGIALAHVGFNASWMATSWVLGLRAVKDAR